MRILIISIFTSLIYINSSAQIFKSHNPVHYNNIADSIISASVNDTVGYSLARFLCKNIGSRLSGSENSMKAIKWAESILSGMKLDTVWLQPVMVPHWVRGNFEKAEMITQNYSRQLNVSALGRSISTPNSGIIAEIIEINSFEELNRRKKEVKDKIVFYNYHYDHSFIETFNGYSDAVAYRARGANEASKLGAVGVLVRSITTKNDNVPHVGAMRAFPDSIKKIPAAAIGLIDADFLSATLKNEPNLTIKLNLSAETLPDILSYNVIGEIKGSEKPDEIIVIGGHLDSWDKGDGAHDNGAPCVQTMEVLDLFKRLNIKPKRTIRCVLFTNEENGVKGALKYASYVDSIRENTVAGIESDRGAFSPRGFYVDADSLIISKLQNWLPILNKSLIDWIKPGESGTDIGQIKKSKALMGYVPDMQRYFDLHHSDNDIFEEVNPREMELGTASIAIMAYLLSEEGL